jgi:serine phosphatase RsbU (regulator of sigma subunit)
MKRERILLLLDSKGNQRLLAELLEPNYDIVAGDTAAALSQPFDLCISDGVTLTRFHQAAIARKQAETDLFLPFLFLTSRHDIGVRTGRLWQSVDELIGVPIDKAELSARVEILLRARRLSLQNFQLRRALENELAHAAEVQAALLPATCPRLPDFEIAARCLPAREVGGDFYDWEEISSGKISFALGDVCGKGMPAALLMATIRATLRALWRLHPPAEALNLAQQALAVDFERSGRFVTLFHAQLDATSRRLRYADAGHGHVFMRRRGGTIEELLPRDVPIGIFSDQVYEEGSLDFQSGDALMVYSDGLTERRPEVPVSRDEIAARLSSAKSAGEMVDAVIEAAAPDATLPDDLTVLVLRCI